MRILLVAAAPLLILRTAGTSEAQPNRPPQTSQTYVVGTGTLSCGRFIESREAKHQEQLDLYVQWVWGFLSAYSERASFVSKWQGPPKTGDIGPPPEAPTVLLYLDKHCRAHPLDLVVDATRSLLRASGGDSLR